MPYVFIYVNKSPGYHLFSFTTRNEDLEAVSADALDWSML